MLVAGCFFYIFFLHGLQDAIHISYVHHVNVDQTLMEGNPPQLVTPTGCCLTSVLNKVTKWSMGLTG